MSFFAPPPTITTEVFTRLPDKLRRPRRSAWADANRAGRETDSFLEGPSFDRQGRLYVTDIPNGRVFRITTAGEWEQIAEYDGWPNGLKIHKDGRIFITCYKRGIMELDAATGRVTPFLDSVGSESFKGVNDLVFRIERRSVFHRSGADRTSGTQRSSLSIFEPRAFSLVFSIRFLARMESLSTPRRRICLSR